MGNENTATSSWYTLDDLDALLYTAPPYKPTENAEQACKANNIDIEQSKTNCKIAGPDSNLPGLLDACVYDYCLTGSDQIVADSKQAGAITKAEMNAADEPTATVGCGSCDLVPCGGCQEGCPVSACKNLGAPDVKGKTDRNGCYPQNGDANGPWPNVKKVAVNGGFKTDFKPGITNYKQVPKECRVATTAEPATTTRRRVD